MACWLLFHGRRALVFLGVFLLLQQFLGWDPALVLMSWWPILFIVLGIEILFYLFIAKSENRKQPG
ncbi:hypothetical protein ACA29_15925 [Lederbergia galactosidilytica]|uniref:LiaF transmembrane domain-containing protein n=1 Tax=Lederbergia galactosidilytica TaxID=217031 RepID=A0A0Q9XSY7_9BACI|nr:hypothetical protein ACA29_15925 [Lederbergia galactosidilytica]